MFETSRDMNHSFSVREFEMRSVRHGINMYIYSICS